MIQADALVLHLNALQEALQPEGDTKWAGLLPRIERVARALEVPVIAKEVGWGISTEDARRLAEAGVAAVDVAGAGGTSWSEVEKHRAASAGQRDLAGLFIDWGIPTAESLLAVRDAAPELELIASGGLRTGIDVAKCVALGSNMCGLAAPFLHAAHESTSAVIEQIDLLVNALRVAMFATGSQDLDALRRPGVLVRHTNHTAEERE
jgi:isopentenyl-diphosphate delta-isomerase